MLRFVRSVLVLALPLVLLASPALAAGWTVIPTPNPSSQANYLSAVGGVSPTDLWAVGAWYRPSSTPGTLTEHWDGARWSRVRSPNATGGYNELYGVAALASNDVWAVGYHNIALYGSEKTMALHWDGSAWTIVPTENMGSQANQLFGVAAISTNDVWAVGFGASTSNEVGRPLAQHWDGTRWSLSRTPDLGGGFGVLHAVLALSSNDVWAVGGHDEDTLVEHWDGVRWSVVPSPNGARPDSELYAISGTGPTDLWAVGETSSNRGGDTLVEHWDGAQWTVVPTADGSLPFTSLNGVKALGPTEVWAVGTTYDPLVVSYRTFTEHWDGASWTVVPSPNPGPEYDFIQGVTWTAGGDVWAVGAADEKTLAMRNTG